MAQPIPLVIVEGFLGSGHQLIWGDFELHLNQGSRRLRRVIFVKVGSVSSLHDRACELFYTLVGGTVDYGEGHSREHKHKRYGRTYFQPLYPQWSKENPLHFLGHSMGGVTITKLQQLIKTGYFGTYADPDMILSATTVSAPFRGTQAVYVLGSRVDAAPLIRPLSFGNLLSKLVHIGAYISPFLPDYLDPWQLENRSLTFTETSFFDLLKNLLWTSDLATTRDVTPWDASFAAADERDARMEGEPNANTYYRSLAAFMTHRSEKEGCNHHMPGFGYLSSIPYYIMASASGSFDFSSLSPRPTFFENQSDDFNCTTLGEEYWANDGIAPLFSQWHPLDCSPTRCEHHCNAPHRGDKTRRSLPEPGVWHVQELPDTTHTSLLPIWGGSSHQEHFWNDQGRWLSDIDDLRYPGV